MHSILKIKQVVELCGLSTASIYRLVRENQFPKQIKLSERSSGWLPDEIHQWLDERKLERDGGEQ